MTSFDSALVTNKIQEAIAEWNIPGLSLGVVREGEIEFFEQFGVSCVKTRNPITQQTSFGVGSVSKAITSLGIMLLCQRKALDLDAPIGNYLPELGTDTNAPASTPTIREFLSHMTGFGRRGYHEYSWLDVEDRLSHFKVLSPYETENKTFRMANINYTIMGRLIEHVTSTRLADFIKNEIFAPLGMSQATIPAPFEPPRPQDQARHYGIDSGEQIALPPITDSSSAASHGMRMSPADMLELLKFATGSAHLRKAIGLSDTLCSNWQNCDAPIGSQQMAPFSYSFLSERKGGFGWYQMRFKGVEIRQVVGRIFGNQAILLILPDLKAGLVLQINATLHYPAFHPVASALIYDICAQWLGEGFKCWQDVQYTARYFDQENEAFMKRVKRSVEPPQSRETLGEPNLIASTYHHPKYPNIQISQRDGKHYLHSAEENIGTRILSRIDKDTYQLLYPDNVVQRFYPFRDTMKVQDSGQLLNVMGRVYKPITDTSQITFED